MQVETKGYMPQSHISHLKSSSYLHAMFPDKNALQRELFYKTSRSGGKGGQNVNKVSSKVELIFDVPLSVALTHEQKSRVKNRLASWISNDGMLHIVCQEARSQFENKKIALRKFFSLLERALKQEKKRVPTRPGKKIKEKRLKEKKIRSEIKKKRKVGREDKG